MKRLRVLVVDDELEFINTLAERLELRNMKADFVTTGKEAIELVKQKEFDVVILDMVLQRTRGKDVLRAMKKIRPDLAIILISGRRCEEDYAECKKEGAFDYLVKPVRIERLIEKMKQAVESARGGTRDE